MAKSNGKGAEPILPRVQATLEERIHAVAKAVCEVTASMGIGQHGFMAPCSRCTRMVIAIQRREDNLPNEREAKLIDDLDRAMRLVGEQNAQVVHLSAGCRCPQWPWCVPHPWTGMSIENAGDCAEHEHVDPEALRAAEPKPELTVVPDAEQ